ncbi:class D sortase [Paenibacillus xylanilyticus]|uniref:Class D sortase n=1 Tax=Paenibacillus xylanilyticus TaxID=248903 RepID=A0A7Y6BV67_9BACL|nr:class D sortase [Paenibacillus xylanilyticus]NUU75509.1 class D sortase [Paenibacillus xylanilyticus]
MKKYYSLLILLGIFVILFPSLQEKFYDWQQDRVMNNLQSDLSKLNYSFEQAMSDTRSPDPAIEEERIPNVDSGALGVIVIDKIDVQLPILEDATEANMKVSATHLVETAPIGSEGNAAIAAHRAHKKGRLFNRLGELEIGDQIDVTLADQTQIRYNIDRISVVEPTDLSVLEDPHLGQVLTLITCDPLINPTHRLIVRAVADTTDARDRDLS